MDLIEHALFLRELAELEARAILLERSLTELNDKLAVLENAPAAPERAVPRLVILR